MGGKPRPLKVVSRTLTIYGAMLKKTEFARRGRWCEDESCDVEVRSGVECETSVVPLAPYRG